MLLRASLSVAFLTFTVVAASAQSSRTIPKQFHGAWGRGLEQCGKSGEEEPYSIGPRFIVGYEHGWDIRRWTLRNGVWFGRGKLVDDQGSSPASVQLQLLPDRTLSFNKGIYVRCPA